MLWDIGAGSGSVSLEAARLCPGLQIFALEKRASGPQTIRKNMAAFNIRNVNVIQGTAPDALEGLPSPDRVFIGGSSGAIEQVVKLRAGK